ncbi:MAG: 23S rRNA (adenine(2503)-C(2))-methyltransferase RlmN [Phycisphaeraceae bacterium]|nr:23S rRNA (adenine(2503)-C(2))-methyltransferase RlmN [Phycisphaeraceae bacterium]
MQSTTPSHFFDLDAEALRAWFALHQLPAFRAKQLLKWVYQRQVVDVRAMTDLPIELRGLLDRSMIFTRGRIVKDALAGDGTHKLLMAWEESARPMLPVLDQAIGEGSAARALETECVMIPAWDEESGEAKRRTACISSQVGCPVGCRFCASGLGGLDGNLTAGQIVEQVWRLGVATGQRISHVVFMGMGEPLANFDNVIRAVRMIHAPWGLGISARRITVSTVGLPAQIRRLAEIDLPVTLAISLHAPNDEVRRALIPWADYVSIQQLLEAGRFYFQRTGREVTLEYILLRDVNDRLEHARELATVARQLRANINLIRFNEVRDVPFSRPASDAVLEFQRILRSAGINTHIRASRGRDIAAACGQLRHEHKARPAPASSNARIGTPDHSSRP